MGKEMSAKIKGVAILIMLCHHFIVMPFSDFPVLVKAFGGACKICVAIYAVLSGYGYYFSKEKTICYGLRKIWGVIKDLLDFSFYYLYSRGYTGGGGVDSREACFRSIWTLSKFELVCVVCVLLYFLHADYANYI